MPAIPRCPRAMPSGGSDRAATSRVGCVPRCRGRAPRQRAVGSAAVGCIASSGPANAVGSIGNGGRFSMTGRGPGSLDSAPPLRGRRRIVPLLATPDIARGGARTVVVYVWRRGDAASECNGDEDEHGWRPCMHQADGPVSGTKWIMEAVRFGLGLGMPCMATLGKAPARHQAMLGIGAVWVKDRKPGTGLGSRNSGHARDPFDQHHRFFGSTSHRMHFVLLRCTTHPGRVATVGAADAVPNPAPRHPNCRIM